ncbi:hypothetical protein GGQ88_001249 [Novosphingobium hassiacum]|uniref:Uncharacterized protein n=1 Tax=Novosphingobium hassiacum TaxID=173676 RepID=A0A7W5ZU57_9SPHN|nr:hypothetical protein [Novosphingobium hassiacum]MBB3859988.1 hypothetical protein [Novosphingobium hassiacum]
MRSDVKSLLDRLNQSQFRYKEFADRFSDLETWPIFEAVIRDSRVFNYAGASSVQATSTTFPDSPPIGSVLSRKYGAPEAVSQGNTSADVRTLLARISSAAEKGEI